MNNSYLSENSMNSLKNMRLITTIWILFAALFLILIVVHWYAALQDIPHVNIKPTSGIGKINGVPIQKEGLNAFVSDFNAYVDRQNILSHKNTTAIIGYMAAFVTSVMSAFLTNESCSQKLNTLRVGNVFRRFRRKESDNKVPQETSGSAHRAEPEAPEG